MRWIHDTEHQSNIKSQIASCMGMIEWFKEQISKKQMEIDLLEQALQDSYGDEEE
tara:strand:- start:963 stop:1127 length:165 start_codon:yes stop_codon:yes gene_type:complete